MNHQGTVRLETERLILRPFKPEDADAVLRNWANDRRVTEFLSWQTHGSVEVSQIIVNEWVGAYDRKDFYQWAIVPKELGEPIGSISVLNTEERTQKMQIGFCIGYEWWDRGITGEALKAMVNFLFGTVGINRIDGWHDPRNPRAGSVMKKCGFLYEGTLHQFDYNNKGIADACMYCYLKSDWLKYKAMY